MFSVCAGGGEGGVSVSARASTIFAGRGARLAASLPLPGLDVLLGRHETVAPGSHSGAAKFAAHRRWVLPNGGGDFFLGRPVALHGFKGVTLLSGQAAVVVHMAFGSVWRLNQKPHTAPGPLPTLPIALAT